MTRAADGLAQRRRAAGLARPAARLRLAVSVLLLLVSATSMLAGVGLLVVRRELRGRDNDIRPCPACHSPAILDGRFLTDEQGSRLLFATPEDAARYAAAYAGALSGQR